MATCKECLHFEKCATPRGNTRYYNKALDVNGDVSTLCEWFITLRRGRWAKANKRPKSYIYRCSACGKEAYYCGVVCGYSYCPNCGVEMEKENE